MATFETRLGRITGTDRAGVHQFLGIRFAEPPVGERRFLPPVRSGAWEGTYDATEHRNRAVQPPSAEIFGPPGPGDDDEDCLFLNVFTPSNDGARPVMCWIHGGGHTTGSGNNYDGSALAAGGDVVVVSVNYRLGVFGFLDLSEHGPEFATSAANGLLDNIAALEWIRDNIADYGGDPDNVTIFGESAGGSSVLGLVAAPSARGLFHKAIANSPGGINTPPPPGLAQRLADGLADRGVEPVIDRLRSAPAEELLAQQVALGMGGAPIDGTVVPMHPTDAIRAAGEQGVPLVIGTNRDEGTLFSTLFGPGFDASVPGVASQVTRNGDTDGYLAALADLYADDDARTRGERVWVDLFRRTSVESALAASEAGVGGWLYRFDLPTSIMNGVLGATHAAEVAFSFDAYNSPGPARATFYDGDDPVVRRISAQWSATLVAFARTGDPNGGGLPEWPQYSEPSRRCLVVDAESSVVDDIDGIHRTLWK